MNSGLARNIPNDIARDVLENLAHLHLALLAHHPDEGLGLMDVLLEHLEVRFHIAVAKSGGNGAMGLSPKRVGIVCCEDGVGRNLLPFRCVSVSILNVSHEQNYEYARFPHPRSRLTLQIQCP